MLNHERLRNTGDGWLVEIGSERVIHVDELGATMIVGSGVAIAASANRILLLSCSPSDPPCDVSREGELIISTDDGSSQRTVERPAGGVWQLVGGPGIPSDAMPMQTVSPDGASLLIGLGVELDDNGIPAQSRLLVVDLETGTSGLIAEFHGVRIPLANWSHEGHWIALIDDDDVQLVNVQHPTTVVSLAGLIPRTTSYSLPARPRLNLQEPLPDRV